MYSQQTLSLQLCHDDRCTYNYSKLIWTIFPNDKFIVFTLQRQYRTEKGKIWLSRERWHEHYSIVWRLQWSYMDLLKVSSFPYQRRFHNKGHLISATEVPKGFTSCVFNRLCVTHSKNNKNGKLKLKSELIALLLRWLLKLRLSAQAVDKNHSTKSQGCPFQ